MWGGGSSCRASHQPHGHPTTTALLSSPAALTWVQVAHRLRHISRQPQQLAVGQGAAAPRPRAPVQQGVQGAALRQLFDDADVGGYCMEGRPGQDRSALGMLGLARVSQP